MKGPLSPTATVYRVYDRAGVLLYVGCSRNFAKRKRAHEQRRRPWCVEGARWVTAEDHARRAFCGEAIAIRFERPLFNRLSTDPSVRTVAHGEWLAARVREYSERQLAVSA